MALTLRKEKLIYESKGFDIVKISQVLYCQAEDNFCIYHFVDGKKQMICRSLKFYEKTLKDFGFCRIHRSYLINIDYIQRYNKGKGGSIILESGKELSVASSRKEDMMGMIEKWVGR